MFDEYGNPIGLAASSLGSYDSDGNYYNYNIGGSVNPVAEVMNFDNPLKDQYTGASLGLGEEGVPWYKDKGVLGAGAGLASALTNLIALPSQIDLAKTQTDALKQNIAFAKEDQGRRRENIRSFNAFNRSAFA